MFATPKTPLSRTSARRALAAAAVLASAAGVAASATPAQAAPVAPAAIHIPASYAVNATPASSTFYITVRRGDVSNQVAFVQFALNNMGIRAGNVDRQFGTNTYNGVRQFQGRVGLPQDGIVGPRTWGAINSHEASGMVLRQGMKHYQVKVLQRSLNGALSLRLSEDGDFGPGTYNAVVQYQRSRGLGADGIVGAQTWRALKTGR